jgi:3,4-dihydroxy 2-butanone 4-phosphate synthase/GTP cyclohydrolase II
VSPASKRLLSKAALAKVKAIDERACRAHIDSRAPVRMDVSSGEAALPTKHGTFMTRAFKDQEGREHLAVYKGKISGGRLPVRIHSSCTTGDCFHSLRCDCGDQLAKSLEYVEKNGRGMVLYMAQEGRGIGLLNKINAYVLQEKGLDTVEANERLGFASDGRDYAEAAEILKAMGVGSVMLMTNNPLKIRDLECHGIEIVGCIPVKVKANKNNKRYLQTKKLRMEHML